MDFSRERRAAEPGGEKFVRPTKNRSPVATMDRKNQARSRVINVLSYPRGRNGKRNKTTATRVNVMCIQGVPPGFTQSFAYRVDSDIQVMVFF